MKILFAFIIALALLPNVIQTAAARTATKPARDQYQSTTKTRAKIVDPFAATKKAGINTRTHKSLGISMAYTSDWKLDEGKFGFYLTPPEDARTKKIRKTTIDITSAPIAKKKDYSLTELNTFFINNSTLMTGSNAGDWFIPSFNLVSSGSTTLYGKPALTYTFTGDGKGDKFKTTLVLASFDKTLWSVNFSALPAEFDADKPVFDAVLKSLSLKQKAASSSSTKSTARRNTRK